MGRIASNRYSFLVDQKLREVPFDGVKKCSTFLALEPIIQGSSIVSVDVNLSENIPLDIVLLDKLLDVDIATWFLVAELVAWKAEYLQTLLSVL